MIHLGLIAALDRIISSAFSRFAILSQLIISSPLYMSIRVHIWSILWWSKFSTYGRGYSVIAGMRMLAGPPLPVGFITLLILPDWSRCFSICLSHLTSLAGSVFFSCSRIVALSSKNSHRIFLACLDNSLYSSSASLSLLSTYLNVSNACINLTLNGNLAAFVSSVLQCHLCRNYDISSGLQCSRWCDATLAHFFPHASWFLLSLDQVYWAWLKVLA